MVENENIESYWLLLRLICIHEESTSTAANSLLSTAMNARTCRVLAATTSLSVISFAVLALTRNGFEYHISIYDAYPALLWICFYFSIIGSLLLVFYSIVYGGPAWKYGICLLFSNYAVFYSLFHLKGYAMYGATGSDVFIHLGIIQTILETGSFTGTLSDGNWYPGVHILGSTLLLVSNVEALHLQLVLSLLFSTIYIVGLFLYAKRLTTHQKKSLFVLALAAPLLLAEHQRTLHPSTFAFMLIPLFMFVFERYSKQDTYRIRNITILFAFAGLFVLLHPLTTIFLFVVVFFSILIPGIIGRLQSTAFAQGRGQVRRSYVVPLFILVIYLTWHSNIKRSVQMVILRTGDILAPVLPIDSADHGETATSNETRGSLLDIYVSGFLESEYTLYQLFEVWVIGQFGALVSYVLLGVIACIIYVRTQRYTRDAHYSFIQLCVAGMFTLILLFVLRNPFRVARYTLLFLIIFVGIVGSRHLLSHDQISSVEPKITPVFIVIVLLVVVAAVLGGANVYQDNRNTLYSTIDGTDWFLDHTYDEPNVATTISMKLEVYLQGAHSQRPITFSRVNPRENIPQNLGYNNNETAADTFGSDTYIITRVEDTKWHKSLPETRWSSLNYYTDDDLDNADNDPHVNKLYTNERYDVWLTHE